jgi:hypothetical protein
MKKLVILSVLAALCFTNCGRKKHSVKNVKEGRKEIVPFYRNLVSIQDMHEIDTNLYLVEPEEFLDKNQYETFKQAMWSVIRDPKSKVYNWVDQPATAQELKDRVAYCDSIKESSFDANGNETITSSFRCDSVTIMNSLSKIEFYESWYLNTKTNLIEKETLGFSLWQYVKEKEAYREILLVFKDEEARAKCKKYYFAD